MGSQRRTSKSAPSGGAFDSHAGDSESIRRPVTPAWPPITYEQYDWPLPPDVSMSNSAKRKIAGPYSAAVTPAISEVAVRLDATVASDAEEAANAIVRFDPTIETFQSFPSDRPGANVRQMLGRPGEVWGAESGTDRLVVIRHGD